MGTHVKERMKEYRERLRKSGLRPVQIWGPDTKAPGFAEEVRRQSLLVSQSTDENEIMDWVEQSADFDGWTWED
ncbi:MAG: antitoxin MazE family protein [Desulfovermiculus sp.]|nr:antitoxin MazE family protein [Desulfovermiculus sp.]